MTFKHKFFCPFQKLRNKGRRICAIGICDDNEISFGKTADKIILDAVSEYKYPVAFNAPIGHVENNQAVKHGALTELTVDIHSSIRYE